jgi:hypothetical protein
MEQNKEPEPSYENLVFMDEYPHLQERAERRRAAKFLLYHSDMGDTTLIITFPERITDEGIPDGAA